MDHGLAQIAERTPPTFELGRDRGEDRRLEQSFAGTTLLAVWAHPDDEAYLGAGLMAAVAARGGRVVTTVATLGERGTDHPSLYPPDRLASIRHAELTGSLAALGAEPPIVLGYPDGRCGDVPDRLGARRVASVIDDVAPEVVLTFGPDGVTGHPDHQAVGRWAAIAVAARDRPPALITTAAAAVWPDDIVDRMHGVGAFLPGYPDDERRSGDVTVTLTGDALTTKLTALRCHRSQIGALVDRLGEEDYARLAATEAYRPANLAGPAWLARARAVLTTDGETRPHAPTRGRLARLGHRSGRGSSDPSPSGVERQSRDVRP